MMRFLSALTRVVMACWCLGSRCCSGVRAVFLADVAHGDGAVEVVEASCIMQVSAVFVSGAETVIGPAVRLTGHPAPETRGNT